MQLRVVSQSGQYEVCEFAGLSDCLRDQVPPCLGETVELIEQIEFIWISSCPAPADRNCRVNHIALRCACSAVPLW